MSLTYDQAKTQLDEIAQRIGTNRNRMGQAVSAINTSQSDLGLMPTHYTDIVQYIDQQATANPGNAAWQNAKAEKDLLVANFHGAENLCR
jgi:hypothetical protein